MGKKGKDNGVLFIIARMPKVEIEVGYGLERCSPIAV